MSDKRISSIFDITPRYLRSTNLERDFRDPRALGNYILTPHGRQCLSRLSKGLRAGGTERAWRITGNYGSGKSSFALMLAQQSMVHEEAALLHARLVQQDREHRGIHAAAHAADDLPSGHFTPNLFDHLVLEIRDAELCQPSLRETKEIREDLRAFV